MSTTRYWLALAVVAALGATGCCKSLKKMSEEDTSPTTTSTATATTTTGGAATTATDTASGTTLTGAQGVAKLKSKGWKPLMEPPVSESGPAKVTTFITSPPNSITISFIEYKDQAIAKLAYGGLQNQTSVLAALYGNTIVQVTCPAGKDRANCQKALDDLK